ncbi:unnamed protein product [Acanthoscelides obtectus]|uniref:Uncharacterized protein n=1 Tax=Acanthoscelides obtectus TaxID=200917 RepID=A0A9P0LE84_ACAOB|nr:unnamed protein product [Acanthoscelides obtectus]CAK1680735.1 hypothetical protein AOBTE_LOCUS32855 [Acanthoscelides obtectus]
MNNVVKNIQPEKKKKRGHCKKNEIEQDVLLKRAATLMSKPIDEFQIFGDFVAKHRTMHYNTQEQSPQLYIQGFGISTLTNDMNHLQQLR